MDNIIYAIEPNLETSEFISCLKSSTLAERRPVEDFNKMDSMVKNASLIITARLNNKLVGVARSISDFVYTSYLSDLAVDQMYQKMGIGKQLMKLTAENLPDTLVHLQSAPKAVSYYEHLGIQKWEHCFRLSDLSLLDSKNEY
jgi:predicted N-acetyltransferase YhbS